MLRTRSEGTRMLAEGCCESLTETKNIEQHTKLREAKRERWILNKYSSMKIIKNKGQFLFSKSVVCFGYCEKLYFKLSSTFVDEHTQLLAI